jgi:two-component system chemotaxis response regulator CheY
MNQSTILIIDDSETVRREVQLTLEEKGYPVLAASDGADALKVLKAHPEVRLAVCDVHMPNMGGIEFVENALGEAGHAGLKVVMLTTSGKPDLVRAARAAGASAWLVKPFEPDMLLATIEQVLSA